MDNQQATDAELGWLAGIIDGEGWLGFTVMHRNGNAYKDLPAHQTPLGVKVELKITNCDEEIIERSCEIAAKLGVNLYRRTHKQLGPDRRPVHECAMKHMTGMLKILPPLLPHLTGIKYQRAHLILRFIERRRANPGVERVDYDYSKGSRGPRTLFPYSVEELALIDACRELQQAGASQTTREARNRAVKALKRENAQVLATNTLPR